MKKNWASDLLSCPLGCDLSHLSDIFQKQTRELCHFSLFRSAVGKKRKTYTIYGPVFAGKSTLVMALKLPNIYYLINGARTTLRMAK